MRAEKHTPGPWVMGCDKGPHRRYTVGPLNSEDPPRIEMVADIVYPCDCCEPGERFEADVRLMTVAPDLLAACKAAYEHATTDPIARLDQPQLNLLRKAIARAEGHR